MVYTEKIKSNNRFKWQVTNMLSFAFFNDQKNHENNFNDALTN